MNHFFCYIARCADKTLYTGYCKDIEKREAAHNKGTGAKYTRARRPIKIIYQEQFKTFSAALKREAQIKKLPKKTKEVLIAQYLNNRPQS